MFDRFTDRARRSVTLAQQEADLLGLHAIGTEALLLGLIHEGEGVAGLALAQLKVGLVAAREKADDLTDIPLDEVAPPVPFPFTPRARKVLELSLREALQLGHNYIGTEHILLGLIREGEGVAAQVLVNLDVDLADLRRTVVELLSGYKTMEAAELAESRAAAEAAYDEAATPRGAVMEAGRTLNEAIDELGEDDPVRPLLVGLHLAIGAVAELMARGVA